MCVQNIKGKKTDMYIGGGLSVPVLHYFSERQPAADRPVDRLGKIKKYEQLAAAVFPTA